MGFWSSVGSAVSGYFSSGSGWSDLLGGVMSGISNSVSQNREDDRAEQGHEWALAIEALRGQENRRTSLFEKELEDYYKQREKYDKRIALDSYGQFSVNSRRSPNYTPAAAPVAPVKPVLETTNGS